MIEFTPTQQRLIDVLSDGMAHPASDLLPCIDELAGRNQLKFHMHNLRKLLQPSGETIVGEWRHRQCLYRHVRLLASAYDGQQ